ncbi:MAG: IPT/TIG domain-containing protein [Bacteroidota bacterium]|nr:IPT/TIG domain-containing protein [Candidatus Kapabacteria bacterium]MDW8220502.1 IPT/TIG domain-containing protein [Bacteroidota bacterium]
MDIPFRLDGDSSIILRMPSSHLGSMMPTSGTLSLHAVGGVVTTSAHIINAALLAGMPLITGVIPTHNVGAGTRIVVTGTNFTHVTSVSVGSIPAASFTILSSTHMTVVWEMVCLRIARGQ